MIEQREDIVTSLEDQGISVAKLTTISLARIHNNDASEILKLERAASINGLFYLDMRGTPLEDHVLTNLPRIYEVAASYFNQPESVKERDVRNDIKSSQDLGWKKSRQAESFEVDIPIYGCHFKTDKILQISREELGSNVISLPYTSQIFLDYWKIITDFSSGCDKACLMLLNTLSKDYGSYHRLDQPSDTGMKLVSSAASAKRADVEENLHTDGGTLTLLFHNQWGLHAFLRDEGLWAFIPPSNKCALINVGNSLRKMSGGRFYSPEHRVTQPFDGAKDRYYVSYFLRPEDSFVANP
jgi:isopenicillin N synthase-like dioxygenase